MFTGYRIYFLEVDGMVKPNGLRMIARLKRFSLFVYLGWLQPILSIVTWKHSDMKTKSIHSP